MRAAHCSMRWRRVAGTGCQGDREEMGQEQRCYLPDWPVVEVVFQNTKQRFWLRVGGGAVCVLPG